MGGHFQKHFLEGIDFTRVLVTTLDADNRIHHDLLSALTKAYCESPKDINRHFSQFPSSLTIFGMFRQSIALWRFLRDIGISLRREDQTAFEIFSSHSQPLSAFRNGFLGYNNNRWRRKTILEKLFSFSRSVWGHSIFFPFTKMQYSVKLFSITGRTISTIKTLVVGCSDIAIVYKYSKKLENLPKWKTFLQYFRLIEGHYMWATAALFWQLLFLP